MNGESLITFANGFKLAFAGILGLLWWDVRKVGKIKENITDEIEEKYLTQDKHTDLCTIASLEMKQHVSEELKASTNKILQAIKNNGRT